MLSNEFIRLPYLFSSVRPPGSPRWGKAHKDFQRQWYRRSVNIAGPVQEMPLFENRVEVDPSVKDAWGIPVAKITGTRHAEDLRTGAFLAGKAEAWLKAAGATQTFKTTPSKGNNGGQHQAGTCRMGQDPKISVTNSYGQLHAVDNVFVVDGSLHVTNGGFNPSLTIMALAFRASEYIAKHWKASAV